MSPTTNQLLEAVLALPYDERLLLAEAAWESCHPPAPEPISHEEFIAELDRRWAEYQAGTVKVYTWEEIKREGREYLKGLSDG